MVLSIAGDVGLLGPRFRAGFVIYTDDQPRADETGMRRDSIGYVEGPAQLTMPGHVA